MRWTSRWAGRGSQLNVGLMLTAKTPCFPAQSNNYCLRHYSRKFSLSPKAEVKQLLSQTLFWKFSLSPKAEVKQLLSQTLFKEIFTQPTYTEVKQLLLRHYSTDITFSHRPIAEIKQLLCEAYFYEMMFHSAQLR